MKNYTCADRKIIETIVKVSVFNEGKPKQGQCQKKYGYVIPLFHGWEWRKTKKQLIEKYTY